MSLSTLYTAAPIVFKGWDLVKVVLAGLLLVIIQSSMAAFAGLSGYGPEWVLALTIYVALRAELWLAILAAFALGFIRDAVGGGFLGMHQFTLVLITWFFYPFRARLNFFSPLTLMPLIFILGLGSQLFIMTPIMAVLGWPSHTFNPLPAFFVSSSLTALLAPIVFIALDRLTRNMRQND
ncbi:rod shape-determining protein MreD [Deltaproteobacteria bacterium Smac51]|nr:rod shape-determining protein MreD [Deltaproteobacteria bacterium Smac51]